MSFWKIYFGSPASRILEASHQGDLKVVRRLLERSPELVRATNEQFGDTPLHLAAGMGHAAVAEHLLANKADIEALNQKGWTPLQLAAGMGHAAVAQLLLLNKASVNPKDNKGWTPLDRALSSGNEAVADLLRANQGRVNAVHDSGVTRLNRAFDARDQV